MTHTVATIPDWVQMEVGELGKSVYNAQPLDTDTFNVKQQAILQAVHRESREPLALLSRLRDGLLTDGLRTAAWPVLLGISPEACADGDGDDLTLAVVEHPALSDEGLEPEQTQEQETGQAQGQEHSAAHCQDYSQIRLDVARAFVLFPPCTAEEQQRHRRNLLEVVDRVLRKHPYLRYYQGFHDVASVVYLVMSPHDDAALGRTHLVLERLALHHLRDFMQPDMAPLVAQLELLPAIVELVDPELGAHIAPVPPYYALASLLTVFAHDAGSLAEASLVWDFVLASGSISLCLYVYAALLVERRSAVLAELDSDALHLQLQQMAGNVSADEMLGVLTRAHALTQQVRLSELAPFCNILRFLVLHTTSVPQHESMSGHHYTPIAWGEFSESDLPLSLSSLLESLVLLLGNTNASEVSEEEPKGGWDVAVLFEQQRAEVEAAARARAEERARARERAQRVVRTPHPSSVFQAVVRFMQHPLWRAALVSVAVGMLAWLVHRYWSGGGTISSELWRVIYGDQPGYGHVFPLVFDGVGIGMRRG